LWDCDISVTNEVHVMRNESASLHQRFTVVHVSPAADQETPLYKASSLTPYSAEAEGQELRQNRTVIIIVGVEACFC